MFRKKNYENPRNSSCDGENPKINNRKPKMLHGNIYLQPEMYGKCIGKYSIHEAYGYSIFTYMKKTNPPIHEGFCSLRVGSFGSIRSICFPLYGLGDLFMALVFQAIYFLGFALRKLGSYVTKNPHLRFMKRVDPLKVMTFVELLKDLPTFSG